MMRSLLGGTVALATAVVMAAFPAFAYGDADIAVTQTAYQGATLDTDVPEHFGPLVITPDPGLLDGFADTSDYVTFRSTVTNAGPQNADVTFKWHISGLDDEPAYTYWTGPAQNTMSFVSGDDVTGETCNSDVGVLRCRFFLPAGGLVEIGFAVRGNAPGSFTIYDTVTSNRDDPVSGNNKSAVFSEPVVCSIEGTAGPDTLTGTSDFDSICGRGGDDQIVAQGAADKIFGGAGADLFVGQPGSQQFVGGRGGDTISYADAPRRVRISLVDRGAIGWGYDTILSVENVIGSRYGDYIEGSGLKNTLIGRGGADRIFGRGRSDALAGGKGADDFISRDNIRDTVYGGPGSDGAYRDGVDIVRSSFSAAFAPFADADIPPPTGG
jgi:Ca2+-binding RTX toxin-like protein